MLTLEEIFKTGGAALLIIMSLVQILPIKIDPWTWLGKQIGKVINAEVLTQVSQVRQELQKVKEGTEEQAATNYRARILRFGDEAVHGVRHSKDHFDQTLDDITRYEQYCNTHPDFRNNMTALTSERIKSIYSKCLENNDFL